MQNEGQIKQLMLAKDKMEQALTMIEATPLPNNHAAKRLRCSIDLLRQDIVRLQLAEPVVEFKPIMQPIVDPLAGTPDGVSG